LSSRAPYPDVFVLRQQAHVMRLREALETALQQRDDAVAAAAAWPLREAELTAYFSAERARVEELAARRTEAAGAEVLALARTVSALEAELGGLRDRSVDSREELLWLRGRAATLDAVEAGGWWRLRGRLLPLVRLVGALRSR
jgi:hypothetical protein